VVARLVMTQPAVGRSRSSRGVRGQHLMSMQAISLTA
jgi:hypothetical protein